MNDRAREVSEMPHVKRWIRRFKRLAKYIPPEVLVFIAPDKPCVMAYGERWRINRIKPHQLSGRNQGFITSYGRYVSGAEAGAIAHEAGQTPERMKSLTSEDVFY